MPNARDITSGSSNILLIGDSGTHKTWFLGTCPKPYVFDFDKGLATVRGLDITYDTFKDIPKAPGGNARKPTKNEAALGFFEFGQGWIGFVKKLNEIGDMIDKGTCPYQTICFDSLTFLSELAMNNVLTQQKEPIIHQGSYGAQQAYIKTVLSQVTAWPIRLVCTAHVQRDENLNTGITEKLPLLTGKLAGFISAFFDEVYFLDSTVKADGKQEFTLKAKATPTMRQAKSRWGVPDGTESTYQAVAKFLEPAAK